MAQWNPMNDFVQGYSFVEGIKDAREEREWKRNRRKRQEVVDRQQDEQFERIKEVWKREDVRFDQEQEDRYMGIVAAGMASIQLDEDGTLLSTEEALRKYPERAGQLRDLFNSRAGQYLLGTREGMQKGRTARATGRFMPDGNGGVVPEIEQVDENGKPVSVGPLTINGTAAADDPDGNDAVFSADVRNLDQWMTPKHREIAARVMGDPRFLEMRRADARARAARDREQAQRNASANFVDAYLDLKDSEADELNAPSLDSAAAFPGAPNVQPIPRATPGAASVRPVPNAEPGAATVEPIPTAPAAPSISEAGYPVTYRNIPHDAEYYGRRTREIVDGAVDGAVRGAKFGVRTLYEALGAPVVETAQAGAKAASGFARGFTGAKAVPPAAPPVATQPAPKPVAAPQPAPRENPKPSALTPQQELNRTIAKHDTTKAKKEALRKAGRELIRQGGDASAVIKLLAPEPELEKTVFEKSGVIVFTDKKTGRVVKQIKIGGGTIDPKDDIDLQNAILDGRNKALKHQKDTVEVVFPGDHNEAKRAFYVSELQTAADSGLLPDAGLYNAAALRLADKILRNEGDGPLWFNTAPEDMPQGSVVKALLAANLGLEDLSSFDTAVGEPIANLIAQNNLNVAPSTAAAKTAAVMAQLMRGHGLSPDAAMNDVHAALVSDPRIIELIAAGDPKVIAAALAREFGK